MTSYDLVYKNQCKKQVSNISAQINSKCVKPKRSQRYPKLSRRLQPSIVKKVLSMMKITSTWIRRLTFRLPSYFLWHRLPRGYCYHPSLRFSVRFKILYRVNIVCCVKWCYCYSKLWIFFYIYAESHWNTFEGYYICSFSKLRYKAHQKVWICSLTFPLRNGIVTLDDNCTNNMLQSIN